MLVETTVAAEIMEVTKSMIDGEAVYEVAWVSPGGPPTLRNTATVADESMYFTLCMCVGCGVILTFGADRNVVRVVYPTGEEVTSWGERQR